VKVLLFGIGNPGRFDDGLGPALAEAVEALGIPGVDVDADYQLTVEDAAAVAEHRVVVFADADAGEGPEPFSFRPLAPQAGVGFSSHGIEPEGVLALAATLFGGRPEAYLLGIRGHEFGQRGEGRIELGEGLTAGARENLAAALAFLEPRLRAWAGGLPQGPG
jgi:hydrogenase maturation protease